MTRTVTSADGTAIAFDRLGAGAPLVLVSGILNTRHSLRELAETLAQQHRVICYDRRGRGESGDTAPYAVEREVEDLAALIAEAGGEAAVYGHSSGAALNAAASGQSPPDCTRAGGKVAALRLGRADPLTGHLPTDRLSR